MKITSFLNKIWIIIKSKIRDKDKMLKIPWYRERIEKCKQCPNNSKHYMDIIKKDKKEKLIWYANRKEEYCFLCKCNIKDKASEELEQCSDKDNRRWERIQF